MSWVELKRYNKLPSMELRVGQKLRIPLNKAQTYTVRNGDNLYKIARQFKTSVGRLVKMNKLKSKTVFPKQVLVVSL